MSMYLHGLGHFHPENEITNEFLTNLDIGTNAQWIEERVGIQSRRTVMSLDYIKETLNRDFTQAAEASDYTHAETGRLASEMALQRAGLQASDIGLVIAGSCNPDFMSPADACTIAAQLGIEAPAFDVNSACTSFHVALWNPSKEFKPAQGAAPTKPSAKATGGGAELAKSIAYKVEQIEKDLDKAEKAIAAGKARSAKRPANQVERNLKDVRRRGAPMDHPRIADAVKRLEAIKSQIK